MATHTLDRTPDYSYLPAWLKAKVDAGEVTITLIKVRCHHKDGTWTEHTPDGNGDIILVNPEERATRHLTNDTRFITT